MLASVQNENVRKNGGVVAVLTREVRQNEMEVIPSPAETPGHVLIPQINYKEYDRQEADGTKPGKRRIKELADRLARIAQVRIPPKPKT
jgi:hypothetical protein